MLAPVDLNLLAVFDAIFNERSVTRAANKLNMSQPAVSSSLARLRDVFGDELFVRSQGTMMPTPLALALAVPVQQIVSRIEALREFGRPFDPARSSQLFTLSVSDYQSILLAPLLMAAAARAAPSVTLRFLDNATGNLADALASGEVSAGIDVGQSHPPGIQQSFLLQEAPLVIADAGNAGLRAANLRDGDEIPLDLFCALPHAVRIRGLFDEGLIGRMLAGVGRSRRVRVATSHFGALGAIVHGTEMLASMPGLMAFDLARRYPLAVHRLPGELGLHPYDLRLYWHRRNDASAAHQWLRALVTDCAQRLASSRPAHPWAQVAPLGLAPSGD